MTHLFNKLSVGIIVLGCMTPVITHADDPYFPLLKDQTAHEGLPKDIDFDVFGFKLLMTPAEVDKRIAEIRNDEYIITNHDTETRGLRDGKGNSIFFKYGRIQTNLEEDRKDYIALTYTSTLLGNRVASINRTLYFKDEIIVSSITESIFNKYGKKPSLQEDTDYQVTYKYFFENGELLQGNGKKTDRMKKCWYSEGDFESSAHKSYKFHQNREYRDPSCNGGIEVSVFYGARKDLVKRIEFKMWDRNLKFKNLHTQDEFLLQAMTKEINSKTGMTAPKL